MRNNVLILAFSIICCMYSISCGGYDQRLSSEGIAVIERKDATSANTSFFFIFKRFYDQYYDKETVYIYKKMYPDLYSNVNIINSSVPFNTTTRSLLTGIVSKVTIDIPITVYVPNSYRKNNPIIVVMHAGGFVYGSRLSIDPAVTHLANITDCIFVSVEYRLAPENRFPLGLEDSKRVVEFVIQNKLLFSPLAGKANIGVMGIGSGANFASVIANELTNTNVNFLITVSGLFNLLLQTQSNQEFNENYDYGFNHKSLSVPNLLANLTGTYFNRTTYLADANSTRFYAPSGVSPLSPKALIIACELDSLRDDSLVLLKQAYADNNVIAVTYEIKGMVNGFLNVPDACPQTILEFSRVVDKFLLSYKYNRRLSDEAIAVLERSGLDGVNKSGNFLLRRLQDQVTDAARTYRYGVMYPNLFSNVNITNSTVPFNTTTKSIFTGRVSNLTLNIPITIYVPKCFSAGSQIIVFFHGGGFVFDSRWTAHAVVTHMSNLTCSIFVNVEYRLAPENKFPYGLEDSKRVTQFVIQNKLLFSPLAGNAKIGVMGTSSGANFASIIANELTNTQVDFLISVYGFFNIILETPSNIEFNQDFNFGYDYMGSNIENLASALSSSYFNSGSYLTNRNSSRFYSPAGVTPLSPKALLVASELDALRDDSLVLLKAAYDANYATALTYTIKGMVHGFFGNSGECPEAFHEFARVVIDFLSKL